MTLFEQVVLTDEEREAYERRENGEFAMVVPLSRGRWAVFTVGRALAEILPDGNSLVNYLSQHFEH